MVGIAIIGQGYMGRTHAEAWASLGYAENIKYVVARHESAPLVHAPSAQSVRDLDIVLRDPEVDIVSICTPTPSHASIAISALRAGKHVLLEKPIALTVDDAFAIMAAAERSGRQFMVAHVVRFFAGYQLLRTALQDERLGRLVSVRATRVISTPAPSTWWDDESQSGGVALDLGIHDFDQANLFLGSPIAVTAARVGRTGPLETTIEYRDGGIAQVLSFAAMPAGTPFTSSIDVLGERGMAGYRFAAGAPTSANTSNEDGSDLSSFRLDTSSETEALSVPDNQPYARQAEYFLSCIETNSAPTFCPTVDAIAALEVSLATRDALASGSRVSIQSRLDRSA
jgi:predicted dehydrogenase